MFGQYYISDSCIYSDHVCETNYDIPIEDNFEDPSLSWKFLIFIMLPCTIIPILICTWCFTDIATKFWAFDWKVSRYYALCSSLFAIIFYTIIYLFPTKLETCEFPISCHEGINDTIITTNYYYQMKECPQYNQWLTYDYSELYDYDEDCENSEWGCCTISTGIFCEEFHKEKYSYLENVKDDYNGHWSFDLKKKDEQGSNCPKIYEMIYEVSLNDKTDYITLFMVSNSMNILILLIINICLICNQKQIYKTTEKEDKEEVSQQNKILIGSA